MIVSLAMRVSTFGLGLLAAVSPVLGAITTIYNYPECWTDTTTSTTMATPIATTTSTLPLTTTVTERMWLVSNSMYTTTFYAQFKRAEQTAEANKRAFPTASPTLTVIVSDVCHWNTGTAVVTHYTTDPKLTATTTVFKSTVTTQTIVSTFT
jgi:hypothetical protein